MDMMVTSSSSNCRGGRGGFEEEEAEAAREKKRRFSEAQVRSMELIFEAQAKLEPRKKQQLAKELGLQPRQVAIWFQNKRARWKSKELERAYTALSADYDALRSSFDSLLHQKNALSLQVQRLAEMLETDAGEKEEDGASGARGGAADRAPLLSLSSHTKNSEEGKSLKTPLEGDEDETHPRRSTERDGCGSFTSGEGERQQLCFNGAGWGSDQPSAGGGCSQWWEFLSYE